MSASSHTPGPWTWRPTTGSGRAVGTYLLAHRLTGPGGLRVLVADSVHVANARLIAAAPVLLEALELYMRATTGERPRPTKAEVDSAIRAALASAREGTVQHG